MTESLHLGLNSVNISGVIQSSKLRESQNKSKINNDFLVRINMMSYNGKPYQMTAYCTHYGENFPYIAGDYVLITGSLKTVEAAGVWKTIIDVKTINKLFNDPQGIIAKREYVKKNTSNKYDNVGGPPLGEPPDIYDEEVPF
jgi:hypothetical protein